jgi:hypothetical protein
MFTPVDNHIGDSVPDDSFNEVKIVTEFGFKFANRFNSRLGNQALKPFLRVANADRSK